MSKRFLVPSKDPRLNTTMLSHLFSVVLFIIITLIRMRPAFSLDFLQLSMYLQGLFMLSVNASYPSLHTLDFILTLSDIFYINFELCVLVSTFQMTYLT